MPLSTNQIFFEVVCADRNQLAFAGIYLDIYRTSDKHKHMPFVIWSTLILSSSSLSTVATLYYRPYF